MRTTSEKNAKKFVEANEGKYMKALVHLPKWYKFEDCNFFVRSHNTIIHFSTWKEIEEYAQFISWIMGAYLEITFE